MKASHGNSPSLGANLSVRNEEHRILRQHLESLKEFCDEIVVTVDEDSTDNTFDICREYTDKVFRIPSGVYGDNIRREASVRMTTDWELWADADHLYPPALQQQIREAIATNTHPCYFLPGVNMFFGHWFLQKQHWSYQIRLFRRDQVSYSRNDLHNWQFDHTGQAGYLQYPLLHYGMESIEEFIGILNRYTSIDLESLKKKRSGGLLDQSMEGFTMESMVKEPLQRFDHLFNALAYRSEKEYGALYAWLFSMYTFVEKAKVFEHDAKTSSGWEYGKIDMHDLSQRIDAEIGAVQRQSEKRKSAMTQYYMLRIIKGLTPPYLYKLLSSRRG